MRVKWEENKALSDISDHSTTITGLVIETIAPFWGIGNIYFIVKCDDDQVRKINISKITVI